MFKRFFHSLFTVVATLVLFSSCDYVDPPFKEDTGIETGGACVFPIDTATPYRKVLLEDYTGHLCGNCPDAAEEIYNVLKPLYGDTLISIGVHSNPTNFTGICPDDNSYPPQAPIGSYANDYRTPSGITWYDDFGFIGIPGGMVSRTSYGGNLVLSSSGWNPAIDSLAGTPAKAKLQILNNYNSSSGELNICIKTTFLANTTGTYNLCALLTEDSIVSWQTDYDLPPTTVPYGRNVPDYVHRHVMRGALNTAYGEEIKSGSIAVGDTAVKSYKINLLSLPSAVNPVNPTLNIDHCHIVAFVFDANTKEILQVEEEKVR